MININTLFKRTIFDKKKLGNRGERIARRYLRRNGYQLIMNNYRNRYGEIDIIAQQGECLCFVEVKYRKADDEWALYSVSHHQEQRIMKSAAYYIRTHKLGNACPCRFDVLIIRYYVKRFRIKHEFTLIQNAFQVDTF